jgi:hypothetical protein
MFVAAFALSFAACEEASVENATLGDREHRSFNDPHVPTGTGPWFEGWYTRITDEGGSRSIAVIVGSHKKGGGAYRPGMMLAGYIGVLISEGNGSPTRSFAVFPQETFMLAGGEPVTQDPDLFSPADFEWNAPGYGSVTEDALDIEIPGVVSVQASIGARLPWEGRFSDVGPEDLIALLPVPLCWHVSSLGSTAEYNYQIDGEELVKGIGAAHSEKNWGKVFPLAWSWGQGISKQRSAQFVYGGGKVAVLGGLTLEPWMIGYRSPRLAWDFTPAQLGTVFKAQADACSGQFDLEAKSPTRTLRIHAQAPLSSFGDVSIPTAEGFVPKSAAESFSARIVVRAYQYSPVAGLFGKERFIEETVFENAALEFGADYICR